MVEDYVLLTITATAQRVGVLYIFVAEAAAYVSYDDIACIDDYRAVAKADAVTWGALAGNGDVVVLYAKRSLQMNVPVNLEDNDAWAFGLDCLSKAARSVIVEIGDYPYFSTTATGSVLSESFSSWKSKFLGKRYQRDKC